MSLRLNLRFNRLATLFNGIDQHVDFGVDPALQFERTDPFSISVWFKTTVGLSNQLIGNLDDDFKGYAMYVHHVGQISIALASGFGSIIITQTVTAGFDDGAWHNVVWTYDGSSDESGFTVYVDNVVEATIPALNTLASTTVSNESLNVGKYSTGAASFDGTIDDAAIFDKELSAGEVAEINLSKRPNNLKLHSAAANLVFYPRMGDTDQHPTIRNLGGANDGTMIEMSQGSFVDGVP